MYWRDIGPAFIFPCIKKEAAMASLKTFGIVLIWTLIAALPAHAGMSEDSSLRRYLELLAAETEESPSLVHFSFSELEAADTLALDCSPVDSTRIVEYVRNLGTALLMDRGCDGLCRDALHELRSLVGDRTYFECRAEKAARYTYTENTLFQAADRSHAIGFKVGYSD